MALLDFYLATSIFNCIPAAQECRVFYNFRAKQYASLTGEGGSLNMRSELLAVLKGCLNKYQHALAQLWSAKKFGASIASKDAMIDLTQAQEELRDAFATASGPAQAGGAKAMQFQSGEDATSVRADRGGE